MTNLTLTVRSLLLAADRPLPLGEIVALLSEEFKEVEKVEQQVKQSLTALREQSGSDCLTLTQVASGYRYQIDPTYGKLISKLWEQKTYRYSNALLETLAIIAWKQPVTRGEVEDIRGVSVSQNIFRVLLDREWIKITGYRDSLGRPALYGTTDAFLDYFSLSSLDDLPPLPESKDDVTL